jgi:hypothetical protein
MFGRNLAAPLVWMTLSASWLLTVDQASAQLVISNSGAGFIDPAVPANVVRQRFDAAFGADFPDRAEFFYGAARPVAPGAPGPRFLERDVDFQELATYIELAPTWDFSIFFEMPVRFLNPDLNANTAGVGDLNAGLKWAFWQNDISTFTFQFRAYAPTGDADRGLGTDHVSLEPGILGLYRLTERLFVEGEIRDWIPISGTENYAGNVLRYGLGLTYLAAETPNVTVRPVTEFVGWSVWDGMKSNVTGVFDAGGDTILTGNLGVRVGLGTVDPVYGQTHSIYAGYGTSLTDEVWYENMARLEYRLNW